MPIKKKDVARVNFFTRLDAQNAMWIRNMTEKMGYEKNRTQFLNELFTFLRVNEYVFVKFINDIEGTVVVESLAPSKKAAKKKRVKNKSARKKVREASR